MATNRLILRSKTSPWVTPIADVTKGSVLTHAELDDNLIYLRGEVIHDVIQSGNTVFLYKINGQNLSFSGAVASGLERINEGSGDGWRLIGRDPSNYGNIGLGAIDFSRSTAPSTTMGSTGAGSVTFGRNNSNPFLNTLMIGENMAGTTTNGYSGSNILASENIDGTPTNFYNNMYNSIFNVFSSNIGTNGASLSTAVIYESTGSGRYMNMYGGQSSAMFGAWLRGGSTSSTVVGMSNEDLTTSTATASAASFNTFGPRFIVGVGTNGAAIRRNGFVVMSDGTSFFPSLSNAEIDSATDDSAITKGWVNQTFSGLTSHYLGVYPSFSALTITHPTASPGNYADVDEGLGNDVVRYIWDNDDNLWIEQLGESSLLTDAQIKAQYENNANTNEFSDSEKLKLSGLTNNTDDYLTGATFNNLDGILTLNMLSGSTFNVDLDDRYALSGDSSTNTDDYVDSGFFNFTDGILSLDRLSGGTVNINLDGRYLPISGYTAQTLTFSATTGDLEISQGNIVNLDGRYALTGDTSTNTDDYVSGATFNTGDGILTLGMQSGSTVTVDLDGRYLTTDLDNQNLTFSANTGNLEISDGNIVNLDGRYALTGHTHDTINFDAHTGDTSIHYVQSAITITSTQVSDFDSAVSGNTAVMANTTHATSVGTDHGYIDQDVTTTAKPQYRGLTIQDINSTSGSTIEIINTFGESPKTLLFSNATGDTAKITGYGTSSSPDGAYLSFEVTDSTDLVESMRLTSNTLGISGYTTAYSFITSGGTASQFVKGDGTLDTNTYLKSGDTTNDYVTGGTFNSGNGDLTLTRLSGGTIITNLDGRYLTAETDSQTLTFSADTGNLEISGGNIVNLDNRYALTGHTHNEYITGATAPDTSVQFNNNGAFSGTSNFTWTGAYVNIIGNSSGPIYTALRIDTSATGTGRSAPLSVTFADTSTDLTNSLSGIGLGNQDKTNNNYSSWNFTSLDTLDVGYVFGNMAVQFVNHTAGAIEADYVFNLRDGGGGAMSERMRIEGDTGYINGGRFVTNGGTASQFVKGDGTLDSNVYLTGYTETGNTDDYVTGATFNTGDGVVTFNRLSGGTFNVDLDGRYLTAETDSQTLTFSASTGDLSISNGNTVNLDSRYSLSAHTHLSTDITDFHDAVTGNTAVVANTIHASSLGTDHGYIDQDVTTTSKPSFRGLRVQDISSTSGSTIDINNTFGESPKSLLFSNATGDTAKLTGYGTSSTPGGAYMSFEVTDNTNLVEVMRLYADELRVSGNTWSNLFTTSGGTTSNDWDSAYNDTITGMTVSGTTTKTISLFQRDGGLVQANFTDEVGVGAGNDYLTGATFNTSTGDLTMTLFSGNTVVANLDNRYALTGHTHSGFVTGATAPDTSVQFNNGGAFSGTSNFTWDGDVNISSTLSTSSGQFINVEELGFSKSAKVGVHRSLGNPFPGIWFNQSSPDITNYAFLAGATDQTIFNTPSGTDMGYRIGNAQKMIIWSTGGVSIGDAVADQITGTDPGSDNLLVGGSISATTFVTDGGTASQFVKGDGTLDSNVYLTSVGDLSGDYLPLSGGTMTGIINNFESTGIDDTASTATTITITNDGFVGVNTTNPEEKLTVNGSIQLPNQQQITWSDIGDGNTGRVRIIGNEDTDTISLNVDNNNNNNITLTTTGVGIGTTSPSEKLEVDGNIVANSFISSGGTSSDFVKGDGSLDSNIYATTSEVGNYLPLSGGTMTGIIANFESTGIDDTASTGTSVTILENGNVGIGTTTPTHALHIKDIPSDGLSRTRFLVESTDADAAALFSMVNDNGHGVSIQASGSNYLAGESGSFATSSPGGIMNMAFTTDGHITSGGASNINFKAGGYDIDPMMTIFPTGLVGIDVPLEVSSTITGTTITANSHVTNGGNSSQFVKGDGSLDSSVYLTSVGDLSGDYLPLSGGTLTGPITATTISVSNISATTINPVDYIQFDTTYSGNTIVEGRIYWDEDNGTLSLGMHGSNVQQQIGEELFYYIKNQSGSTITNGSVVKAAGTLGSSGKILGEYMIADGSVEEKFTLGVATEDILDGDDGYVTEFGLVRGIDTTGTPYGETWNDGDILWVSPTIAGGLTNVQPISPNLKIEMAIVIHTHVNGNIFVRPTRYPHLHDLQEATWSGGTESDLDIIQWDSNLSGWTITSTPVFNSISATTISTTVVNIDNSQLDYQENLTVDSATTETIATVSILSHKAVFFDYVVSEGTNIRAGTIMSTFMGGTTAFTDNSTTDIGDTSGVVFSTDISGSDLRLLADTTTNGWEIKVMIRAL